MGAALDKDMPVIITEYMPKGSLFDVLQGYQGNMPYELQIHIACAAASGMVCTKLGRFLCLMVFL
jgi:hypothetical protein